MGCLHCQKCLSVSPYARLSRNIRRNVQNISTMQYLLERLNNESAFAQIFPILQSEEVYRQTPDHYLNSNCLSSDSATKSYFKTEDLARSWNLLPLNHPFHRVLFIWFFERGKERKCLKMENAFFVTFFVTFFYSFLINLGIALTFDS